MNYFTFQPQKKKKDRRKGKGGDVDEDDEEDVMLKLKKLSVQASDEEDEPGLIFQAWSSHFNHFYSLEVQSFICVLSLLSTAIIPSKGKKNKVCHQTILCFTSTFLTFNVSESKACLLSLGWKHLCCSQPGPERWWGRRWGGWFRWRR